MAKDKRKNAAKLGEGTPTETDREVLKRAEEPVSADAPNITPVDGGEKIEPVDLSLHGDGVTHWQDEPQSARKARRAHDGKARKQD